MTDFFREVDEEYRRDRVLKALSRYQVPLAIVVVLIIAGTGGYKFWANRQQEAAEAVNTRYMAATDLAKAGNTQQALLDFIRLAKDAPAGYATLARLQTAGLVGRVSAESGAKAFDAIANDEKVPVSMRDVALLRGAILRIDLEDPKAFEMRYGRYGEPSYAYRASMRELLALAAMKRGDYPAAGRYFDEIITDFRAPESVRFRAQAFRELVNGGAVEAMTTPPSAAAVTPLAKPSAPTPAAKPAAPAAKPATPAQKPAAPAATPPAPAPH